MASSPRSPVRIRITSSTGVIKIFPSPMLPVWAAAIIVSTTISSRWSGMMISILVLGRKSATYKDLTDQRSRKLLVPSPPSAHLVPSTGPHKAPRHAEQHTHNMFRIGDLRNEADEAQPEPHEHEHDSLLRQYIPSCRLKARHHPDVA